MIPVFIFLIELLCSTISMVTARTARAEEVM
jgi:hypothetical protein